MALANRLLLVAVVVTQSMGRRGGIETELTSMRSHIYPSIAVY